jgi:hypothetical protein
MALRNTVLEKRGYWAYFTITHPFLTPCTKSIHIYFEANHPSKDDEGSERELIKSQPDHVDAFAHEEKNVDLYTVDLETDVPLEVKFIPQVFRDVQAV